MKKILAISVLALASFTSVKPSFAQSDDPIVISVSLDQQFMRVFRGTEEIANSNISSGKEGHDTPTGIFSVLQKNRHHRSNIYSNAPMPFMQRLTWSGIALHASNHVPRHPASHGCIRMPYKFAGSLFKKQTRGVHVVIEEDPHSPKKIKHELLFQPKITWSPSIKYDDWVNTHIHSMNVGFATSDQRHPARIFITRRTSKEDLKDTQRLLNKLGFDAGAVDGIMGPATWSAISRYRKENQLETGKGLDTNLLIKLYSDSGELRPPNGRMLVRKHHKTIYVTDIHIEDAGSPLGSHLLTVSDYDRKAENTEWIGFSLKDRIQTNLNLRDGVEVDKSTSRMPIQQALSRIKMSKHDHEQINRFLSPGSSITISDNGMSIETGAKGTDFIVLTDPQSNLSELAQGQSDQAG